MIHTKNKLKKFAELENFENVVQPKREHLLRDAFDLKGVWAREFFKNDHPIVLELGCGTGEYTLELAKKYPEKNFVGVDIKGARFYSGARRALENSLHNAAFLRMQIDLIDKAFGAGEVDEIWITFPDPQIKYKKTKHRLTNLEFLKKYKSILREGGVVHLKTDSEFLHGYTLGLLEALDIKPIYSNHHIYKSQQGVPEDAREIKTLYERGFIKEGKDITLISFTLDELI